MDQMMRNAEKADSPAQRRKYMQSHMKMMMKQMDQMQGMMGDKGDSKDKSGKKGAMGMSMENPEMMQNRMDMCRT